ncbi:unnamed protein product [Trichobilharzia regenti]|nr:unnamed protein product [Trichobilharzia regenti]
MTLVCWHTDPNYRPTFKELCLVLCEMKATPSRYLFIMPELRLYNSNSSQQTSTSQSAFEFLSSRLSDIVIPSSPLPSQPLPTQSILPTNPTNHQTDLSHELTNHDEYTNYTDYNEYTQLHYDWIKNLYINSRANLFPDCFSTLLDNYNNYLIGTNISNSDHNKYNNFNTKYQNNYIKFQNKVFELPRQNQVFNDQGIKKCRRAAAADDDDGNTDSVRCLINNDENTSVHASPRQQEYTNIEKADNKDLEYLEIGLQQQQQRESTEDNLLPLLKNDQCGIFTFNT